ACSAKPPVDGPFRLRPLVGAQNLSTVTEPRAAPGGRPRGTALPSIGSLDARLAHRDFAAWAAALRVFVFAPGLRGHRSPPRVSDDCRRPRMGTDEWAYNPCWE